MTESKELHEQRTVIVNQIRKLPCVTDDYTAELIEKGCYKVTRENAREKHVNCKWSNPAFVGIYKIVCFETISALDPTSDSYSPVIADQVLNKSIDPKQIASIHPYDMQPERKRQADDIIQKSHGSGSNAVKASTFYRCACGSERTQTKNVYSSRADEGVSKQVRCLVCGGTWRES